MVSMTLAVYFALVYGKLPSALADPQSGRDLVSEAGLNAQVLAAAGCNGEVAHAIAADIASNTVGQEARNTAVSNLTSVVQQLELVKQRLATNPRDEDAFRSRILLLQAKRTALEDVAQAEHALRVHSLSTMSEQTAAMIESGARSRGYNIPGPVRVAMPADSDWKLVAGAVRARQRSSRMGTPVPEEFSATAQAIDSNALIATAAQNYQANIAAVRAALAVTIDPNNP